MTLVAPPRSCKVYTPAPLAGAMVLALEDGLPGVWLEPCVGKGAFLTALAKNGVTSDQIVAIDLDETPSDNDTLARTSRGEEFLAWSLRTNSRFDRIVGNPPYANLDQVDPLIKRAALALKLPDGNPIGSGSNCWVAFVCASVKLLRFGGSLSFVLPAAWDYADYAAPLRDILPKKFATFQVHRSRRPLFDSVQDGSIVIIGRGFGGPSESQLRFEYDSPEELIEGLNETSLNFHAARETIPNPYSYSADNRQLGDVLDIRLGGVTGDADYFLLTEAERIERRLPVESVRPVLSKARHLIAGQITRSEWQLLRDNGARIWLFDPSQRTIKHPAVQAYLNLKPESGGCHRDRYKITNRAPWYRVPLPLRVDGFMSGMTKFGPWICLRGMPRLTATNTLYTVRFCGSLGNDEKSALALSILTSRYERFLDQIGRIYPSGLVKYEPGDLANLPLVLPNRIMGAKTLYPQAISALLNGRPKECRRIADQWFEER